MQKKLELWNNNIWRVVPCNLTEFNATVGFASIVLANQIKINITGLGYNKCDTLETI
jgi:hypothetical protein